jgi:7-cyano-7-deazaguanine tRNA-ribosyltransferase
VLRLDYPFLWLGSPVESRVRPWTRFGVDGLVVNAFNIFSDPQTESVLREKAVKTFLTFRGPVMIDSGGYLFMRSRKLQVDLAKLVRLYEEAKPDCCVVMDHPLDVTNTKAEIRRRQITSLKNTETMMRLRSTENPTLIPVIHGFDFESVDWYLNELERIGDFEVYGIGSLVPSVFSSSGVGGIHNVIQVVSHVRKRLPSKKIHVFGIGSTLTMHMMFYCGADMVDSSGWRLKAAYGAVQMPGTGDRWITKNHRHKQYPQLSPEEKTLLEMCTCPACKEHGFSGLESSFTLRALHNAWVYQKEVEIARRLVNRPAYEKYLEVVYTSPLFKKLFNFAQTLKASCFIRK